MPFAGSVITTIVIGWCPLFTTSPGWSGERPRHRL